MKRKKIEAVIESRFKAINKLSHKIIKHFDADDIHDFRVEVKKLRAFLRLLDIKKRMHGPLIAELLKTFYGDTGIIRNIQLHRQSLIKYITDYKTAEPKQYFTILNAEKARREKDIEELMKDKSFDAAKKTLMKNLPGKLKKSSIKKFAKHKLDKLKKQLNNLKNDAAIHTVRKVLKDILYTWNYIKNEIKLPKAISKKKDITLLTAQLGSFMDKCIQVKFLQAAYLNKIKNADEKILLLKIKNELQHEKQLLAQQLQYSFNELLDQL